MKCELTKKDIRVIAAALESHIAARDDGIFFDIATDCHRLKGTDYKTVLHKIHGLSGKT